MGIITAEELANVLLAHIQTNVAAELSRGVEMAELAPLVDPVHRLLFPDIPLIEVAATLNSD